MGCAQNESPVTNSELIIAYADATLWDRAPLQTICMAVGGSAVVEVKTD